ncbi:hypothetical protein F4859DRAFT_509232 [Xylaria cf. heliscus]|nr:hypothetical protein F4859DRAFT_509232 [Xylaria cf. heliscus]
MGKEFDLGTRIRALTLHSEGYSRAAIVEKTGYSASGLSTLISKAKKRGYKPREGPILREFVDTEPGKGRPPLLTEERKKRIVAILTSDKASRKLTTQQLADRINSQSLGDPPLCRRTVLNALNAEGFKIVNGVWQSKRRATKPAEGDS